MRFITGRLVSAAVSVAALALAAPGPAGAAGARPGAGASLPANAMVEGLAAISARNIWAVGQAVYAGHGDSSHRRYKGLFVGGCFGDRRFKAGDVDDAQGVASGPSDSRVLIFGGGVVQGWPDLQVVAEPGQHPAGD
jgi:hypothetical protein